MAKAVVYTVTQNLPLVRLNEWLNYIWPEMQTPTGNIKPSWVEFDYCSVMCAACVCVCLLFWMTDYSLKKKNNIKIINKVNKEYLFIYSDVLHSKMRVFYVCLYLIRNVQNVSHSISAVCTQYTHLLYWWNTLMTFYSCQNVQYLRSYSERFCIPQYNTLMW